MKKIPPKQAKKLKPLNPDALFSKNNLVWLGMILIVTLIAYFPSFRNAFTNWDDNQYVSENPLVKNFTLANIAVHFSQFYMGHYHPFTMLSLMIDHLFGGSNPFIFHFTNVLLHLANTFFVFVLVFLLTKKLNITIITAALFGLHSLHVESVAWISERKDVLYTFFYLASLIAYVFYIRNKKRKYYFYALLLFLFSLFSKAQAVSLAVVIILIDYLEGRKWFETKALLEKIPFLILAVIFGYISMQADRSNLFSQGMDHYNWMERILLASYGLGLYFYKLIIPLHLSNWYPYPFMPAAAIPGWLWFFMAVPVLYLLLVVYCLIKNKIAAFALLFFGFNIVTMLQLFPVRDVIIADRYVYVGSIGFFILAGLLFDYFAGSKKTSLTTLRIFTAAYLFMILIITNTRAAVWKDSLTLWGNTLSLYPQVSVAHLNYGKAILEKNGDVKGAIQQYDEAIRLNPKFAIAYNNRAVAKDELAKSMTGLQDSNGLRKINREALDDYTKAISLLKDYAIAYSNRAMSKKDMGNIAGALQDIDTAITLSPKEAAYYRNRALIRMAEKKYKEAINDFSMALKYDRKLSLAWSGRGTAKHFLGDYKAAITDYDQAIYYEDNNAEAYFNRAAAKMKIGETISACTDLNKAALLGNEQARQIYSRHCN